MTSNKAVRPVTFDMADPVFQKIVAEAVAVRLAAMEAEKPVKNTLVDGKTENQLKLEVMTVKAFKKAGYGQVVPRVDCMTYNLWMKSGFKVKTGEKAIKIKQLRLFHSSQVERIAPPSKADMRAEGEAAMAKSTVTQMKPAKGRGKPAAPSQPGLGV